MPGKFAVAELEIEPFSMSVTWALTFFSSSTATAHRHPDVIGMSLVVMVDVEVDKVSKELDERSSARSKCSSRPAMRANLWVRAPVLPRLMVKVVY